jgi:3-methyladenine DNA glycosylase AlkD
VATVVRSSSSAAILRRRLHAHADPAAVPVLRRFFKTGPGEYGEGDVFIGVKVHAVRAVAREGRGAALDDILALLRSRVHEERLLALILLVDLFRGGDRDVRRRVYIAYLAHTEYVNNWDLVDVSAPPILGGWLEDRSRRPLVRLARSRVVWERRMAILATFHFIKRGEVHETLRIAEILLKDEQDLIHKAVGWMLREVGKRDIDAERRFLDRHARSMPRTMLRYAIERFAPAERKRYLTQRS